MSMSERWVYVAGPLTDMSEARRVVLRKFYEDIGRVCERNGLKAYVPHLASDPVQAAHLTPMEVDVLDRGKVMGAVLVIAYVGEPSTGVGIEVEIANQAGIPVWLLYEQEKFNQRRVSRLVRGNPAAVNCPQIAFADFEVALAAVNAHLITAHQRKSYLLAP